MFDETLMNAWMLIWTLTDMQPLICQSFLDNNGVKVILDCLKIFKSRETLTRSLLGILSNISEHELLASKLTTHEELMHESMNLLDEQIEASTIIANLMKNGPDSWQNSEQWNEADKKLGSMVQKWDIATNLNIQYNNLEPVFELINSKYVSCQNWGLWILANLTTNATEHHCSLLIKNPATIETLELSAENISNSEPNLASITLNNLSLWNKQATE